MPHQISLQALDMIIDDVLSEINLSVSALDAYLKEKNKSQAHADAETHLNKLSGIFSMLEMVGAKSLVQEISFLNSEIDKRHVKTQAKILELVSTSLLRLYRYLEHVNLKNFDIPELLLPSINQLRGVARKKPLSESAFFKANVNKPREDRDVVLITTESSAAESRHFRQMYQIGLIEVIRQTNKTGGLKMMQKALYKLDVRCPRPSSPNLWWLAKTLMNSLIDDSLHLSKERLKLFSRIDRQIRNIENKSRSLYHNHKIEMDTLALDMLYLVWISQSKSSNLQALLRHFELPTAHISDSLLRKEFIELSGPSQQDFSSVADAMLQELSDIEVNLAPAKLPNYQAIDIETAMIQMHSLNNMLRILQVDDQVIRLSMAIDLIEKSIDSNTPLAERDINILHVVIEKIRESVNESELANYSIDRSSTRTQLSSEKAKIRSEAHAQVKQLMEILSKFTREGRKILLLKPGAGILTQVRKLFIALEVKQAIPILDQCSLYFLNHLQQNPKETSNTEINLFADVIASLEFFLETMQFTANPSERILKFAEQSLATLQNEQISRSKDYKRKTLF
jgi:hypothetical protein